MNATPGQAGPPEGSGSERLTAAGAYELLDRLFGEYGCESCRTEAEYGRIYRASGGRRAHIEFLAAQRAADPAPRRAAFPGRPLYAVTGVILGAGSVFLVLHHTHVKRDEAVPSAPPSPLAHAASAPPPARLRADEAPRLPADMHGADWLAALPPGSYVLQLLSAREPATVENFIAQSKIAPREFALIETGTRDERRFVLVYSHYASVAEARAALPMLSADLRRLQPWPKPVSALLAARVRD